MARTRCWPRVKRPSSRGAEPAGCVALTMVRTVSLLALALIGVFGPLTRVPSWAQHVDAMRAERRLALVIGNAAYPTSPLRNPVNDARAMAKALRAQGFDVQAHED